MWSFELVFMHQTPDTPVNTRARMEACVHVDVRIAVTLHDEATFFRDALAIVVLRV